MTLSDADAIALLEAMVRRPSPCGQEEGVAAVLLAAMADAGVTARRDEVGNVVGRVPARVDPSEASPHVLILGHMDTAPGWFEPVRREGTLYGRGTVDAKGPLAAAVAAAARARSRAHVTVIGAVQEEGPSVGARHLVTLPRPEYLIIAEPGGSGSVVLGYKGSQRFTISIARPAGHSAGPGPTAPECAADFWQTLTAWCAARTASSAAAQTPHGFNDLTATLIGMASSNDGLRDTASLHIGLRLPPGLAPEVVRAELRVLLPEASFAFEPGEAAVRGGKRNPLVAAFLRSIRAVGEEPRFKVKTGTSDMNIVGPVWNCAMVAYGPGDSSLDHTPDEHVSLEEYLRAIDVLTGVLEGIEGDGVE